jgi:hypothetical protein
MLEEFGHMSVVAAVQLAFSFPQALLLSLSSDVVALLNRFGSVVSSSGTSVLFVTLKDLHALLIQLGAAVKVTNVTETLKAFGAELVSVSRQTTPAVIRPREFYGL